MAKSIFGVLVSSSLLPKESILDISARIIDLFKALKEFDSVFSKPYFLGKSDSDRYEVDIISPNISEKLAELILEFEKGSIAEYEKETMPTINFSRDFGFSRVFQVFEDDKPLFTISVTLGRTLGGGISIRNFNKEKQFSFNWYFSVLKLLVNKINAESGFVSINNSAFISMYASLKVKYPLGWINYFSKSCDVKIPNDIEGVEYEQTDEGKYLILTREDFTENKELFFSHRERLIAIMEEIKRRVPDYSK